MVHKLKMTNVATMYATIFTEIFCLCKRKAVFNARSPKPYPREISAITWISDFSYVTNCSQTGSHLYTLFQKYSRDLQYLRSDQYKPLQGTTSLLKGILPKDPVENLTLVTRLIDQPSTNWFTLTPWGQRSSLSACLHYVSYQRQWLWASRGLEQAISCILYPDPNSPQHRVINGLLNAMLAK